MNRFFIKKLVTAIMIISVLLILLVNNLINVYPAIKDILVDFNIKDSTEIIKSIDKTMNENIYERDFFINSYGYIQNVLGKKEENNFEVVKDKDDILHYTYFASERKDVGTFVDKVKSIKENINDKSIEFMYLMTPSKRIKNVTEFNYGMPENYVNETADSFLYELKQNNIEYVDFRNSMLNWSIKYNDLFYKTDHHWKVETAFYAYIDFVNYLEYKYKLELDPKNIYTNFKNYDFITYDNSFVGSMARKAGILYSGVDDFTIIYPRFETEYDFYFKDKGNKHKTKGTFEEVLIYGDALKSTKGVLDYDSYTSYLYGNHEITHIVNKKNSTGPKIVFINDSFIVPFSAFLSNVCSEIYLIDPRYIQEDIISYVNSIEDVDFVIMSFYSENISEEFFNFI